MFIENNNIVASLSLYIYNEGVKSYKMEENKAILIKNEVLINNIFVENADIAVL